MRNTISRNCKSQSKIYDDLPPVIYLDNQDYSRFGDVLRGKSDLATEKIFLSLEARKQSGDVIFAVSMPILGELLQYDANFRDTTLKKAEAVERLCGSWALAYPSRLVAAEVARAAQKLGLLPDLTDTNTLSADRYWYPHIPDCFDNLKAQMKSALDTELALLTNLPRKQRRIIANKTRKIDFAKAAVDAAPAIVKEYGLPIDVVTSSIAEFLRGKITSAEANRRLFSSIAEPVKFVELYFEKLESDRSLPTWLRKFGEDLAAKIAHFRDEVHKLNPSITQLENFLTKHQTLFGQLAITAARSDAKEFGIEAVLNEHCTVNSALTSLVPAYNILGIATKVYLGQTIGLNGTKAKVEPSFGGDLFHSLYMSHVDLWRGDIRFSTALISAMPQYADRIVPRLRDLPSAIERALAENSRF